jgi:lysophospholipase L1-like esterase
MYRPTSGIQLYKQRLEGLNAGRTYTLLPPDSFREVWEGATGQPTYQDWKDLLYREAKAIAYGQGANRLVVLLGDSLTLWFPPELLISGRLWLNQGISGDNTAGMLKRLWAFSATRPDVIYVLGGINDLRQGKPDWVILKNLEYIVDEIRQAHPEARVVLQSILPTRLGALPNTRIRKINAELETIARKQGAMYLELNSRFTEPGDILRRSLTTDGVHLSRNGYLVWQKAIAQAESRLVLNRSDRYQQWLKNSEEFTLHGRRYNWVPYRIQPGDTLEAIAEKTLGSADVDYYDTIAIKNDISPDALEVDRTIYIPQVISA